MKTNTDKSSKTLQNALISIGCQVEAARMLLSNMAAGETIEPRERDLVRDGLMHATNEITAALARKAEVPAREDLWNALRALEAHDAAHSESVLRGIEALRTILTKE